MVEDIKAKNETKLRAPLVAPQKQETDICQVVINPEADVDVPDLKDEVIEEAKETAEK
ncbi:Hypothetical predicted protein [Mytilus galloprovincialis]|uniref:Uncharacterized protein n=1 Tax=Mytilus galloprovincialis TaxID=29158 RepID=A0A8B6FIY8_MYTGA|nr:Hypothetical predicted protein [Mytilus galloprovincialis]